MFPIGPKRYLCVSARMFLFLKKNHSSFIYACAFFNIELIGRPFLGMYDFYFTPKEWIKEDITEINPEDLEIDYRPIYWGYPFMGIIAIY